jgi:NitT/TauT family transport system ATP-binding protein
MSLAFARKDGEDAVVIEGLSHAFRTSDGGSVLALRDVGLRVGSNEFVAVVGPSGCGKSTLLRVIAGLVEPTRGRARALGEEIGRRRSDIGLVFQRPTLLPWLDVLDNVLFPLRHMGRTVTPGHRDRAIGLLGSVGLADFAHRLPSELSGGMQQRVGICRALITDPLLLLMDEPFAALDALTRDELGLELLRICGEQPKAVLFITHSIQEAVMLADRVVVMSPRPGRVRAIVPVPIERPRGAHILRDPRFQEICGDVRDAIA